MDSEQYYYRKLFGLCVKCGKPLPIPWSYAQCNECLIATRKPRKLTDKRTSMTIPVTTVTNMTLDEMAREAREQGTTYAKLQQAETLKRQKGVR